jgi:rhodanese-related sulfurtransferase
MDDQEYIVIDVREPFEFNMGHIANAINVPSESLMNGAPELKNVPKDASIIIYCKTGSRSGLAMQILKSMGFTNLINGINRQIASERFGLK